MSRKRFYRLIFDINYWNNLTNNRRPSIIHQRLVLHLFPPLKSIPENMLTSRPLTNILTFSIHKFSVQERLVFPSRVSLGCPRLVSTLLNHKPDEGPLSTTNGDAGSTRSFVFPKVWIDVCACLFTWRERHHHLYLIRVYYSTFGSDNSPRVVLGATRPLYRRHLQSTLPLLALSLFLQGTTPYLERWIKKSFHPLRGKSSQSRSTLSPRRSQSLTNSSNELIGRELIKVVFFALIDTLRIFEFLIKISQDFSSRARFKRRVAGLANRIDLYAQ